MSRYGLYLRPSWVFYVGMTLNKGQVARETTPLTLAIAKQIKAERNAAGMSQQELATRASMSITTLRRVETGSRPPTVGQVADVADALGISLSTLICRAEERAEAEASRERLHIPPAAEVAAMELRMQVEAHDAEQVRNETVKDES